MRARLAALAGLGIVAGCGAPPAAPVAPAAAQGLAASAAPAWQVRGPGGREAIDPGVPPDSTLLDARGCAACHAAIAQEWARSRHAVAWTNWTFQREYSARPQAWCVNCHAPLATQQLALDGPRAAQGVDCAACHVRRGALVARARRPGSPHATVVDPELGSAAFCADCHQFTFPVLDPATDAALRMTAHPMQDTVAQFRAGPFAREPAGCLACHGSEHGHQFAGAHDRGMLEAALQVQWCRAGAELRATVRNVGAGHAVPTGDIHRHLYLRVWRAAAPEAMIQAYFGRRFEPAPDGGKRTTWDSTLAPGAARTLTVDPARLGGAPGDAVLLELVYVYALAEVPRRGPVARRGAAGLPAVGPEEPGAVSVLRRSALPAELAQCME
jgi:hypothetical protein